MRPETAARRDRDAGPRRFRVIQVLFMQGILALILLAFVWLQRGDTRSMALYAVTLVVPVGWGLTFWTAWKRDEAARREGRATKEFLAKEKKRSMGMLGILLVVWVALALAVFALL